MLDNLESHPELLEDTITVHQYSCSKHHKIQIYLHFHAFDMGHWLGFFNQIPVQSPSHLLLFGRPVDSPPELQTTYCTARISL